MRLFSGSSDSSKGSSLTGGESVVVVFDDIEVRRLDANGGELEQLLSEPFSGSVPSNWTASGGTWTVSSTGHPRLDLSQLDNLVVKFDHLYELNV